MTVQPNSSNWIFKFADETTVVGRISSNDKTEHRNEIENLVNWYSDNNLSLNVTKTKEIVIDFRKRRENMPLSTSMGMKKKLLRAFGF